MYKSLFSPQGVSSGRWSHQTRQYPRLCQKTPRRLHLRGPGTRGFLVELPGPVWPVWPAAAPDSVCAT